MIKCKTDYNNSFIAGFLEGDGCIYHTKTKKYLKYIIKFCNNNKKLLINIENVIGKGNWWKQTYKKSTWLPTYSLSYDNQKSVKQIAILLSKEYLSKYRKTQLKPILKKFKLNPYYKNKPNKEWIKGFIMAEGSAWIAKIPRQLKQTIKTYNYRYFGISQNQKKTLVDVQNTLQKLKIKSNIYKVRKNYRLYISLKNNNLFIKQLEVLI